MAAGQAITPELQARIDLGKAGKLWRIEVLYTQGPVTGRHCVDNRYWHEVIEYRERLFKAGLMVPRDPGHWIVVSPYDIDEVHLWKQDKYFKDSPYG